MIFNLVSLVPSTDLAHSRSAINASSIKKCFRYDIHRLRAGLHVSHSPLGMSNTDVSQGVLFKNIDKMYL